MLKCPRIAPLTVYAAELRSMNRGDVPDFDPLNGGTEAEILFLFEKPGRLAARSGFISRNNDDPTAEATFDFLQKARLKPSQFLIWNTVPWWNDTRKLTAAEIKAGLECLEALLKLLSRVRVVTLVGKHAQQVASDSKGIKVMTGKKVFESFHPSPLVRANHPDKWLSIPEVWKQARKYIGN